MSMAVGPSSGDEDEVISTINTTPLVDVMLVLLIIFLITIPVVTTSIPVALPKERVEVVTTGMVIRKMISSTSITSTRGVVLIAEMTSSSSPLEGPTAIAISKLLDPASDAQAALPAEPRMTALSSSLNSRTSSITALLRRASQL